MPKVPIIPLTPKFANQVIVALRKSAEICSRYPETDDLTGHFNAMAELIEQTPVAEAETSR
jgi:hypothetical protein